LNESRIFQLQLKDEFLFFTTISDSTFNFNLYDKNGLQSNSYSQKRQININQTNIERYYTGDLIETTQGYYYQEIHRYEDWTFDYYLTKMNADLSTNTDFGNQGRLLLRNHTFLRKNDSKNRYYLTTIIQDSLSISRFQSQSNSIKNSLQDQPVKIYPNPTQEIIAIETNYGNSNTSVKLIGMDGRLYHINNTDKNRILININHLRSGQYIVQVKNDGNSTAFQILVVKD